jgi:GNAT superfamily N-acetyltransferase
VRPLRQRILRPHKKIEELVYPGDDAPESAHFGVLESGELVAVISVYRDPMPDEANPNTWRLRGVATEPSAQRKGYGRALLNLCIEHARQRGGEILWCNGRTSALPFYASLGFETRGDEFELPGTGTGPHYVMWRKI